MSKVFFVILICYCSISFGQQFEENNKSLNFKFKNSIEFELFGHGCFYSIDYERLILNREKFKTLGQLGLSIYPENTGVIPIWIPISINQLISFNSHHIEAGVGQILVNDETPVGEDEYKLFGSFKIGYRYQKPNGRILLKAAFTPVIDYWDKVDKNIFGDKSVEFIPWGGITFGYNF